MEDAETTGPLVLYADDKPENIMPYDVAKFLEVVDDLLDLR